MRILKYCLLISLFLLISNLYSQVDEFKLSFYENIKKKKERDIFQLILILEKDTLSLQQIRNNIFLNPLQLHKIDKSNRSSNGILQLETGKYIYVIKGVSINIFECKNIEIYIDRRKKKKQHEFILKYCNVSGLAGYCCRYRSKKYSR